MKPDERFIAVRNHDYDCMSMAFADFMQKTEGYLNSESIKNPNLYKNCSPTDLEKIAEQALKTVAPSTPFLPTDIKLVSGHAFPDILAARHFGVEVKSTNKDKWTSTGSSIVESTRDDDVGRIYMLFGRLGSTPPSFKCKPYQECLCNIAVTHSPRYLIDMMLEEGNNIFVKMKTDYDTFRQMPENEKISQVRQYFINKAKDEDKVEMPWWMGETSSINLSIYSDKSTLEKTDMARRAFILFPAIYDKDSSIGYKQIALWLCNRYSVICHNVRDSFSAGGKVRTINGRQLSKPYPNIVKRILDYREGIEALLTHPDSDIIADINEYWDSSCDTCSYYPLWISIVEEHFKANSDLKDIPIRKLIEEGAVADT